MRNVVGVAVFFLFGGLGSPMFALAQDQDPAKAAQNKLLAKRAAEADCYRKLAESVYGVQIDSETYVKDFVTESDVIRTGVSAFIRGIKLGQPRYYEDGVCEVDGEVNVEKLITTIKELHAAHYKGNTVTTTDIEQMKQFIKTDVIKATGNGAPRPELPPDLPEGIEGVITPLPQGYTRPPVMPVPALWKTIEPQARLLAKRAAIADAYRKLLEQVKGLRLTSDTLVRDFVTESDEIRTQAQGIVVGAAEVGEYYHNDELIVEVTMEVPVERVLTKIKELHAEHYHGNKVTTTDIVNLKKIIQRDMVRATGTGVPPSRFVALVKTTEFAAPGWFTEEIKASGQGTDPAIETGQGRLKASRAATLDAMRKLAEQVYGLQISSSTTVRDFVTEHDDIQTQVQAVLRGAVPGDAVFSPDGIATITVSLPGAEVWSVVHQEMVIVRRRG